MDADKMKDCTWQAFNRLCDLLDAGTLQRPAWWPEESDIDFPSYEACYEIAKKRVEVFDAASKGKPFNWPAVG